MNSPLVLAALILSTSVSLWLSTKQGGAAQIGESRVNEVGRALEGDASGQAKERVVSASLMSDELLEGVLPWQRWAAVSYVVDWPQSTPASSRFPRDLRRTSGNTEDILALSPDLVVVSAYNNALTAFQLRDLGIPIASVASPSTFDDLFRVWMDLAVRVGYPAEAEAKIREARRALSEIHTIAKARPARVRALLLQGSFSYGGASLQGDCLRHAGLENLLEAESWGANPQVNAEQLLHLDPDVIYVADDVPAPRRMPPGDLPVGYPWRALRAYETRSLVAVPSSWMASISHHALLACRAYAEWAPSTREGLHTEGRQP